MLTVEVKGIDVNNKGALLMLLAILEQFDTRGIQVNFVIGLTRNHTLQRKYPVSIIVPDSSRGFVYKLTNYIVAGMPAMLRRKLRVVGPEEIDLVLDASGFAYSDQWGAKKAKARLGNYNKRYKKHTPLIILPQAFGPFEQADVVKAVQEGMQNAELIFARDHESYNWMRKLLPESECLAQAPDFTQGLSCRDAENILPAALKGSVFIVMNSKMIEKGGFARETYIGWFEAAVNAIRDQGDEPLVINHEGPADAELSEELARRCGMKQPVISHENPLVLKKVISQCKGGVVSRFHAAVSALSQGVPVYMLGWSHNYQELAKDYHFADMTYEGDVEAKLAIDKLYRKMRDEEIMSDLVSSCEEARGKVSSMWEGVFSNKRVAETIEKYKS